MGSRKERGDLETRLGEGEGRSQRLSDNAALAANQAEHDAILAELPAATRPAVGVSGVGLAAHDPTVTSTGMYLAAVTARVLDQQPPSADLGDFRNRVRAQLTADGIDPDNPGRMRRRP